MRLAEDRGPSILATTRFVLGSTRTSGIGVWFMTGGSVGGVARLNALTLQVDASVSLTQTPAFRVPPTAVLDPSRHTIWIANYRHSVTRIDTG